MKEITKMERDLMTAITHSLAEAIKEGKKLKKLLELYRELMTVKDNKIKNIIKKLIFVDSDYYVMEKKETYLEKQIKELENE